ncbi:MAG TPA: TonB-dependent receptor, partial [Bryobacteraceae bacterium]|nr:TonB-dependent receptor [Bryobacteraceae bacterium]
MRLVLLLLAAIAASVAQEQGEVRGVVLDGRGGEPLDRVEVRLAPAAHSALTGREGRFVFQAVPPGDYQLRVSTVGYRLLRKNFSLSAGDIKEFEIILTQDTLRHTDSIEVAAGPFDLVRQDSPSELTLAGSEAKNLAGVLADDPLRAVQALPGVASGDDFDSRFSLRGAGNSRVGLYLDDILLHSPFHMVAGEEATGSITALNGDIIEGLSLYSGAFPTRFMDRTAGVLAAETREGTRLGPAIRLTASASNAALVSEGPLGSRRRGSWLLAARKSYLQYIIRRTTSDSDPAFAFGILDGQAKLAYDLTSRHYLSLSLADGFSDLDRTTAASSLGANAIMTSGNHLSLANLAWRYAPGGRLMLTSHAAYMRERFANRNRDSRDLEAGYYGEWVWQSHASWAGGPGLTLDAGWSARRIRATGFENRYQFNPAATQRLEDYGGRAWRYGGYFEQSWTATGWLRLSTGARWDRHSASGVQAVSPHSAMAVSAGAGTEFRLGWGQYAQFPDLRWHFSTVGRPGLLPERANHAVASVERRLGTRTRLRAEFYQREDRDLLFRPFYEPRLIGGK